MKPTIFAGPQQDARLPGGDLRAGRVDHVFKDFDDAIAIANDTLYGLGAGVWTRDGNTAYRAGRAIQAGRVWTNCYHLYPAHAAFGGYKQSGIGRETHKMMLDHYQQTKNLLVSYYAQGDGVLLMRRSAPWSARASSTPRRPGAHRVAARGARAAALPSVGRLLRRQRAHVLSAAASSASAQRDVLLGDDRRVPVLHGRRPVRVLEAHRS